MAGNPRDFQPLCSFSIGVSSLNVHMYVSRSSATDFHPKLSEPLFCYDVFAYVFSTRYLISAQNPTKTAKNKTLNAVNLRIYLTVCPG